MALLEVVQTKYVSASVRMTESTASQLNQYGHFVGGSADEVIEEALKHVFAKDRDFQDFLKTPRAKDVSATLRIRKAPASEVVVPTAKKPAIGPANDTQSPASVAGSKA